MLGESVYVFFLLFSFSFSFLFSDFSFFFSLCSGVQQTVKSLYKEGGIKVFFSGVVPRMMWLSLGVCAICLIEI